MRSRTASAAYCRVSLLKLVRRDSLALFEWIRLCAPSWSDGLGSSLGPRDPRFARTGSWYWRTSRFGSNSPCGRRAPRPRLRAMDRIFWVVLSRLWKSWRNSLRMMRPETVVGWHRQGFRRYWAWKSRRRRGRPAIRTELRDLIRRMSHANPLWGAPRIHGELLKLGLTVSQAIVAGWVNRH